mmetsp:Transcript_44270/g.89371  ORF Transcript_44270/g.89371 Transcript_44270/m.89371 type:complete len:346 (+) Transcript_44270:68-1105(+)
MLRIPLILTLVCVGVHANNRPVIGIYAQPYNGDGGCPDDDLSKCQYIAASYVKFVESSGGRAVPISYYASDSDIDLLFENLNGVLFPGGGSAVPAGAFRMYANAKTANAGGDYFPVWGTCMGFQWLLQLEGASLDGGFDSENVSLPLNMTEAAAASLLVSPASSSSSSSSVSASPSLSSSSSASSSSRLFAGLDPELFAMLQSPLNTSAFNNHGYGITPQHFQSTLPLADTFTVLSTSADRNGNVFVSTMEATDPSLPFYGVQWHPEKNAWELGSDAQGKPYENIPHTSGAVAVTLYLAQFLLTEARKSNHVYSQDAEAKFPFIWKYPISDVTSPEFMQSFIAAF